MTDKRNITIRPAAVDDARTLASLIDALNRFEGNQTGWHAHDYEIALKQWLADRDNRCSFILALVEDEPVGYMAFYEGYDIASMTKGVHLGDIYVAEASRRQGVGKALLAALSGYTMAMKGEWVSLTVLRKNQTARAFYQSFGAVVVDVDFTAFGRTALQALNKK